MDVVDRPTRSRMMAAIGGRDTKPELLVRKALHAAGLRFRLHRKGLPGTPDIVLPRFRTVVFVHGCFWHRHRGCRYTTTPRTNASFWQEKFDANVARDKRQRALLRAAGWQVIQVWECQSTSWSVLGRVIERIRSAAIEPQSRSRRSAPRRRATKVSEPRFEGLRSGDSTL